MTMQCGAARRCLYAMDRGSPVGPAPPEEVLRAREHVAACTACRDFFAAEEQLQSLIRARLPQETAPAALREKVLAMIAEERGPRTPRARRSFRGSLRRALGALGLVAVLAGGIWLVQYGNRAPAQPFASILVEDHVGNLSSTMEIATSDPEAVQKWFRERAGFAFRLPATSEPQLLGGRLCHLQGRKAALIWYRHPRSTVSLYILDAGDAELSDEQMIALDGKRCMVDARKGYSVVIWKERGLLYGLVSDVRGAELLQLAAKF